MDFVKQMSGFFAGLLWSLAVLFCGMPATAQAQNVNADDIKMVSVASGSFTMGCTYEQGSACSFDEKPSHQVQLKAYSIAKYPVTQKLWKAVMGNNPSRYVGDDLPVHNVTWEEVQMFIQRLNQLTGKHYRLPTEAEWEYAARGGIGQPINYRYAGNAELDSVGWYSENSGSIVHAVGGKQPNALGLYDMSGNVWEWCSDIYGMYDSKDQTDPVGASKGYSRVLRGGCYAALPNMCRITTRKAMYQGGKDNATGFRLALDDDNGNQIKEERERLAPDDDNSIRMKAEQERPVIPHTVFFTVNNEIWNTPQWGIGFKVGTMKKVGWYFSALTNFNYKGIGRTFTNGGWYYLTGERKTSYFEALAGITARLYKPVSFHFGVGYNYRTLTFGVSNGSEKHWYRYDRATCYGPALAAGFMFHIKSFVLSAEGVGSWNLNRYSYYHRLNLGCNVGVGFCIPVKKQ